MLNQDESKAESGEVWIEADGTVLLVWKPGEFFMGFGNPTMIPWVNERVERPLTRFMDKYGNVDADFTGWAPARVGRCECCHRDVPLSHYHSSPNGIAFDYRYCDACAKARCPYPTCKVVA